MGEARRRKEAPGKPFTIKGPFSYEIAIHRLDDILAGSLMALFVSDRAPSARTLALVKAAAELAARMGDQSFPTMLCAFCDHDFARGERPTEIFGRFAMGEPGAPADRQPDMRRLR